MSVSESESKAIRERVLGAARRLTAASAEHERLGRRREFLKELHERGNWLAGNPRAEAPEWVKPWSDYFERLQDDPENTRIQAELMAAREDLHSPEFEKAIEYLRLGEGGANADWAIAYLEADPWYFRSGYFKGRLGRWLRQVRLTDEQQAALREVVLNLLKKGSRFEQVELRKLARRIETAEFRAELQQLMGSTEEGVARRAALMLRFCELNDTAGRNLRGAR